MKRAVLYLRASTLDQTTANQERELREIAVRMGWEILKVYKDHGISGATGKDKCPEFDRLVGTPPSGNSTWSWRGQSIGLVGACRIWSASYPNCML
jgi:hypothetical protein